MKSISAVSNPVNSISTSSSISPWSSIAGSSLSQPAFSASLLSARMYVTLVSVAEMQQLACGYCIDAEEFGRFYTAVTSDDLPRIVH
jgi:hypothetical protein